MCKFTCYIINTDSTIVGCLFFSYFPPFINRVSDDTGERLSETLMIMLINNKRSDEMGVYDIVGREHIQIKCTKNPSLKHYGIGDEIQLVGGLYIGYEGWFVVSHGKIIETGAEDTIYDKWGDSIDIDLDNHNPVQHAIKRIAQRYE